MSTTRAYFTEQSASLARLITTLGNAIGVIMGIGAVFGT